MKKLFTSFQIYFLVFLLSGGFLNAQQDPQEWTILETYSIPGKASGLAWDGQYLYAGLYSSPGDDNLIYRIDPSDGSYSVQCSGPMEKCYGLTYDDGTGNLWSTDHPSSNEPGIAIQFEMDGDYVSEFDLPATYFSGIAYDLGAFWATCYYDPDGEVYQLTGNGTIMDQFAAPAAQPWDICLHDDDLWIVEYNDNKIFKIDRNGNVLETYDSEGIKPAGIVFDGQYLWYIDGPLQSNSNLYKVDLSGSGNPDVNVPVTEHDYGVVTENETAYWDCLVENNGTADLEVTFGTISGMGAEFIIWPEGSVVTVEAGGSALLDIDFNPTTAGVLDAVATLETNDPVSPEIELHLTGIGVYDGPHLEAGADSHDFGNVRVGAHTRWQLKIKNMGDEPLIVSGMTVNDPVHFYVDDRIEFPVTISTLDSAVLGVWFHPDTDASEFPATLTVSSNDPNQGTFEVALDGSGLLKEWEIGSVFWTYQIEDPIDASPKAIIGIQDVTGDGVEDVIVCSEDDFVRCFNGNSHGIADVIWAVEIPGGSVYHQNSISVIEDIDGDGHDDVVVGTAWADRSIVALSGYSGAQIWKYQTNAFGDGGWVYQVNVSYDYNDDGFPDVLAATGDDSADAGPKRVFCLDGKSGEVIFHTPFTGPVFSVIGIEDYTGDGQPDVVAGVSNNNETEASFYSIDGATGDAKWNFVTNGSAVWALSQIDDINGNGVKDIFAGVNNGEYYMVDPKTLFILNNGGIGNFTIVRSVVIDDITRDGFQDVLLASSAAKAIVLDGAEGGYALSVDVADKSWVVDRIGDITGDDQNDVVAGTLFSNNHAYFIDTYTQEILFSENYSSPLDAIKSISDINGGLVYGNGCRRTKRKIKLLFGWPRCTGERTRIQKTFQLRRSSTSAIRIHSHKPRLCVCKLIRVSMLPSGYLISTEKRLATFTQVI